MRLHRFFIEEFIGRGSTSVSIKNKDLLHQWKNVFRFQVGHKLILLDNSGYEFHAEILLLTGTKAELTIVRAEKSQTEPTIELFLFAALIKKDNFEWVLEKGTEIGVSHFIPVLAERSEKKNLNIERGNKIILEASEQSGRAILPKIHESHGLKEALDFSVGQGCEAIFFLDPTGDHALDKNLLKNFKKVALFVGPEGGWSKNELELVRDFDMKTAADAATTNTVVICTFGKNGNILRAETASIVGSAIILL